MIEAAPSYGAVFHFIGRNAAGRIVYVSDAHHNLVVTSGRNLTLDRLFGIGTFGVPAAVTWLGIGTDGAAPQPGQVQLNPVTVGTTFFIAASLVTRTNQTVTFTAIIPNASGNFVIAEAGLFNGPTNGTSTMLNRTVISPAFTKTTAISLTVVATYQQT